MGKLVRRHSDVEREQESERERERHFKQVSKSLRVPRAKIFREGKQDNVIIYYY